MPFGAHIFDKAALLSSMGSPGLMQPGFFHLLQTLDFTQSLSNLSVTILKIPLLATKLRSGDLQRANSCSSHPNRIWASGPKSSLNGYAKPLSSTLQLEHPEFRASHLDSFQSPQSETTCPEPPNGFCRSRKLILKTGTNFNFFAQSASLPYISVSTCMIFFKKMHFRKLNFFQFFFNLDRPI